MKRRGSGSVIDQVAKVSKNIFIEAPASELIRCFEILSLIKSEDIQKVLEGLETANRNLSQKSGSCLLKNLIDNDIVDICKNLISRSDTPAIVNDALLLLEWISNGDREAIAAIGDNNGMVELLINALSWTVNYADKAALILANLAAKSPDQCQKLVDHGIVDALVSLDSRHHIPKMLMKKIVWLVGQLFHGNDLSLAFPDLKRLLPFVAKILQKSDAPDIIHDTLLTLYRITANATGDRIESFFEFGFWQHLEKLLDDAEMKDLQYLTLLVFGNVVPAAQPDYLNERFMAKVNSSINSFSSDLSQISLRIIRIMTSNSPEHLDLLFRASSFSEIWKLLSSHHDPSKSEVANILYNCVKHGSNEDILKIFIENKIYQPFTKLLSWPNQEMVKKVAQTLCSVQKIAKQHGFDKDLEALIDPEASEILKSLKNSREGR